MIKMKVLSSCIGCFGNQISLLMIPEEEKRKLFVELFRFVLKYKNLFNNTPIELAKVVYKNKIVVNYFKKEKEEEIKDSLEIYRRIKKEMKNKKINISGINLWSTLKISAKANIIDFARPPNIKRDIIMKKDINELFEKKAYHSKSLSVINESQNILYLTDNSFEIGFDLLTIEKLKSMGKNITIMVRYSDFINDITVADLKNHKINHKFEEMGVEIKTIDLYDTSKSKEAIKEKDLIDELLRYDLIISKGQANYETISEYECKCKDSKTKVIYVMIPKCNVISKAIHEKIDSLVIKTAMLKTD